MSRSSLVRCQGCLFVIKNLLWNVCGLRKESKSTLINNDLEVVKAQWLGFQETKLDRLIILW